MRILFVITSVAIEGGGASKMLVWVANQFARRGDDVYVYTHKNMNGPRFRLDSNINLISDNRKGGFLYPVFIVWKIRLLMKKLKPDVVVSFMQDSNLYCMMANRFLHVPVVTCERTDPNFKHVWKIKIAMRLAFLADGGVFQLQNAADYYTWVHKPKAVIPNPIPESKVSVNKEFSERRDEICNTARLVLHQKRQDVLIYAFKKVLEKHPEMKLVLFGDGIDADRAKDIAINLNIEDKVIFKGTVSNPIEYIVNSKLFVLSSDYEGISNSLAEAMSAGLTCISTDTSPGGARLLIDDGVNGCIVPCNDPDALAKKICYCLDNPEKSDSMARNAKESIKKFSEERISNMWFSFIDKIVKGENRRGNQCD